MTEILTEKRFSRPAFLKGTGALVVGFSLAGAATAGKASAAAARGDVAGPPDATQIDTWLAVNADNTATVYMGKVEIGQGNDDRSPADGGRGARHGRQPAEDRPARHEHHARTRASRRAVRRSPAAGRRSAPRPPRHGRRCSDSRRRSSASPRRLSPSRRASSRAAARPSSTAICSAASCSTSSRPARRCRRRSAYRVVGTRVPRIDIPAKVSGEYTYLQNVRTPGMLHGRVVRPRGQAAWGTGAKVVSVDASSIKSIPGAKVVHVGDFLGVVAPHEYGAVQAAAQLKVKWADDSNLPGNADLFGRCGRRRRPTASASNTGNLDDGFKPSARRCCAAVRLRLPDPRLARPDGSDRRRQAGQRDRALLVAGLLLAPRQRSRRR